MKKRILSLVLVLVMCVSMFTFGAAVQAATLGELMEFYKERLWDWQENQFGAMIGDQETVMTEAWDNYEANKDAIREKAVEFVDELLEGNTKFYETETMKDLYKWKLMRDIMEEKLDVTSQTAGYEEWLADFTAFEEANDEAISASAPVAALNGLGDYSDDLTEYFGQLRTLGVVFEGADEVKANALLAAYDGTNDDMDSIHDYLVADVKELMVDGLVNGFEIGMQLVTNQINRGNTTGVFDMISDRDMKAAFLLVGEDLARYALDLVPGLRSDLLALNKKDIVAAVIGDATPILGGDNEAAINALYDTMNNLAAYMLDDKMDKIEDTEAKIEGDLGIVVAEEYELATRKLKEVMEIIEPNHGVELVHINTFLGRELLRYENEGEYVYLNGAEIDGDTVTELALGFKHNRYPVVSSFNDYGIASFDANYDADGFKIYAGDDIGQLMIEVTEEANGEATVNVYRGYLDADQDGEVDGDAEDVYRYVTAFTVKATSDVVVEPDTITLEDIADFKLSEQDTITIKGTTTLDNVVVSIALGEEEKYVLVHTKAEFEAGIVLNVPEGAKAGDVYTVAVGEDGTEATDTFEILAEDVVVEPDTITLEDIADFKLSEQDTITIKGTTTLDNVVVSIALGEEEKYVVVHTKAEFEAGIVLNVPEGAKAGDVYTVAVGEDGTEATDTFEILAEAAEPDTITLEDIADFKLSEQDTITIKGTTTLDNVVVSIVLGEEEKYVVVHTKAEFEAGIVLNVPDNAQVGDVYTVTVGEDGTEATDTFTILAEEPVAPSGSLGITATSLSISVGKTKQVTATPQNVKPEGATVEIVWTDEEGKEIAVVQSTAVSDINGASTATIEKLAKGTEKITATLYVNGVEVASKTVTIKNPSVGGPGVSYTNLTVKVDETKDVVKVPAGGVNVEFDGTGDGEVEVSIVDGVVVVTGIKVGVVKGELKITNENGKTVLSGDYKITVTEKDVVVIPEHECEWPDIAATATKDAHWAHETIDIMTINGYIKGYEDGTFKPDQNITRAEFSAIVYRILGLEVAEDGVIYDDTEGHWAEDIIATMSLPEGYGMLRGYGDGNFGPNDNITREQAVAIIARAKSAVWVEAEEGAKDIFTDAEDISWWFDGEMDAAVANGLITGYEDGSYKPLNFTTRAEACVLLARAWPEVLE